MEDGSRVDPSRSNLAAEVPGAAPAEAPRNPPRFAVAGQIIGRRRTVFAAIPTSLIRPNPLQPRQHFDPGALDELASSIRARGLLQPIIVRRDPDGGYTVVAGERRLRAAEIAGVSLVPAILSNDDLLEVALEENLQREDLSPLEEAEALAALATHRGHSHARLAELIHKSRPYVSNTLALTRLPEDVKQEYFAEGATVSREIMISIARQETPEAMRALWRRVKLESMSVKAFRGAEPTAERPASRGAEILRLVRRLNRVLGEAKQDGGIDDVEAPALRRALRKVEKRVRELLDRL